MVRTRGHPMHQINTRSLLLAFVSATAVLTSACGSSGGEAGPATAIANDATAVSATSSADQVALNVKAATSKVEPIARRGAEAPLDSTPEANNDLVLPVKPIDEPLPTPGVPTRIFASGFEGSVALTVPSGFRDGDRQLVGTDTTGSSFPLNQWGSLAHWSSWVLSSVGQETSTPVTYFLTASIKSVAGRNGGMTNALSLHSKVRSGGGGNQRLFVQNAGMSVEAVMYQRMWIKLDAALPARAKATGASNFQQTFWEVTTSDYRMRLKIRYDSTTGLYWEALADRMDGEAPAWQSELKSAPIMIAPHDAAAGWHRVEIWMDRPNGRFKLAIDGDMLANHIAGLPGDKGSRTQQFRMMMMHGGPSQLGEMLFDDLEIWDAPPIDAWVAK